MDIKEAGERFAFLLTSDSVTAGSWRTNKLSDIVADNEVLREYQERGWGKKVWDLTVGVWENALVTGEASGDLNE